MLGKNIAYYRRLKGLTQKALAEEVGITPSAMSRIESGTNTPTWENPEKIAQALEMPTKGLVDGSLDENEIDPIRELIKGLAKATELDEIKWRFDSEESSDTIGAHDYQREVYECNFPDVSHGYALTFIKRHSEAPHIKLQFEGLTFDAYTYHVELINLYNAIKLST